MKPSARILGALTLAAVLAATMIIVAPTRFPRLNIGLPPKPRGSLTPRPIRRCSTVIQWVRKFFSRTPRKDRMGMDFCPSGVPTSRHF